MMISIFLSLSIGQTEGRFLPENEQVELRKLLTIDNPEKYKFYRPTRTIQYMAVNSGVHQVTPHPMMQDAYFGNSAPAINPNRLFPYVVPGGLFNVPKSEWSSNFAQFIPENSKVLVWVERAPVSNAPGGWLPQKRWEWPEGSKFVDLLTNSKGEVFETRLREKEKGIWKSSVPYRRMGVAPIKYMGPQNKCSDCHASTEFPRYFLNMRREDETFSQSPMVEGSLNWDRKSFKIEEWRE